MTFTLPAITSNVVTFNIIAAIIQSFLLYIACIIAKIAVIIVSGLYGIDLLKNTGENRERRLIIIAGFYRQTTHGENGF